MKRWQKHILIGLAILIGLPITIVAMALVFLNTNTGRDWLANALSDAASTPELRLAIERIEGGIPWDMTVRGIRLGDTEGSLMSAKSLELSWSPTALLGGRLSIDKIELDGFDLQRLPATAENSEPEAPGTPLIPQIPVLPVSIDIQSIKVDSATIGPGIAGSQVTVNADGHARWVSDEIDLDLVMNADRADGGSGRIDLKASLDPATRVLEVDIAAEEPAGGLVAGLLGLEEQPPMLISAKGTGPLNDWKGRVTGGFGQGAEVDLALTLAIDSAGQGVSLDGTVDLQRLLPEDLDPLLPDPTRLFLDARQTEDGIFRIDRLQVTGARIALTGSGTIDVDGSASDLSLQLRGNDLSPLVPLSGVMLNATLTGPLDRPALDVDLTAAKLGLPDLSVEEMSLTAKARPQAVLTAPDASLAITLSGRIGKVDRPADLAGSDLTPIVIALEGTARPDGSRLLADKVEVTVGDLGRIFGNARLEGDRLHADLSGDIPALARLGALGPSGLDGNVDFDITASATTEPLAVDLSLAVDAAAVSLGNPVFDPLLSEGVGAAAAITIEPGGDLTVQHLSVDAGTINLDGDGKLQSWGATIDDFALRLDVADLSEFSDLAGMTLSGAGAVRARLAGPASDPSASLTFDVARPVVDTVQLDRLSGVATAATLVSAPTGEAKVEARLGRLAAQLASRFTVPASGPISLDEIVLAGTGIQGSGAVSIPEDPKQTTGYLNLDIADLGPWGSALGQDLAGQGQIALTLPDTLRVTGTAALRSLRAGPEIALGSADLDIDLDLAGASPSGRLKLDLAGADLPGLQLSTANMNVEGTAGSFTYRLEADGAAPEPVTVISDGTAVLDLPNVKLGLNSLNARYSDYEVRLLSATEIAGNLDQQTGSLTRTQFSVPGGRLDIEGTLSEQDVTGSLTLAATLSAIHAALGSDNPAVDGQVKVEARLSGPPETPSLTMTTNVTGVRGTAAEFADLSPASAKLDTTLREGRLENNLSLALQQLGQASANVSLPVTLTLRPFAFSIDDGALKGGANGRLNLAGLGQFLPIGEDRLSGLVAINLTAGGTTEDPQIGGTTDFTGVAYESAALGSRIEDMDIVLNGTEDRLELVRFSATDGGSGRYLATGGINFGDNDNLIDVNLKVEDALVINLEPAKVRANADIDIKDSPASLDITGSITVAKGDLEIPRSLPLGLSPVPFERVSTGTLASEEAQAAQQKAEEGESEGALPIRLDLTVDAPETISVSGRGLASTWKGALTITGTANKPRIRGTLEAVRGSLNALTRTFNLQRGRIVFTGSTPPSPTIDIVTSTRVNQVSARFSLRGTPDRLQYHLSSQPPLPQEEITSRILFGQSASELSATQAVALASSLNTLSGGAITGGITETVFGVFDSGGPITATTGKTSEENPAQQAIDALSDLAGTKIGVGFDFGPNIQFKADVGVNNQPEVSLNWFYDY